MDRSAGDEPVEDACVLGDVTGADVVWFLESSVAHGTVTGAPVILEPHVWRTEMRGGNRHVWYGDCGWREPERWPLLRRKKE